MPDKILNEAKGNWKTINFPFLIRKWLQFGVENQGHDRLLGSLPSVR